jgi:hypothetical protein
VSEPYEPPKKSWRLTVLMDAPLDEVKRTIVDCPECPVFILCKEGEGGTGWWCAGCGSTGVWVSEPTNDLPRDLLDIDCAQHGFERAEARKQTICGLCSGGLMQLEYMNRLNGEDRMRNHLVLTIHSKHTPEDRQKTLRREWDRWKAHYSGQKR